MIKTIFFDLDDTLMDTQGQVLQPAYEEACALMINRGLKTTNKECQILRKEVFRKSPRKDVFLAIAERCNGKDDKNLLIAKAARDLFYQREVKEDIKLFSGAEALLKQLMEKYNLFLVTAGGLKTQMQKVKKLKLEDYFKEIYYVEQKKGQSKKNAFEQAIAKYQLDVKTCLSVGNRLDKEIAEAKELGFKTCYMKHDEYTEMTPENSFENPDFEIQNICDLIKACQL